MANINFGIDLGTTNSAIAKFTKGEVEVFSNPLDYGKRTLPSVVAFKKDKIYTGKAAKTRYEKDAKNVKAFFKRKMGTSESFKIPALSGQSKTPVDLSAFLLKELKTFVSSGEVIDAAIITIPAAFDTIQSNATKDAGKQAGFKQVILVPEPVAASLAYANKTKEQDLADGQWLVYDLGGGTFDVALVRIKEGEMKIIDHEGDNFLGGYDFDQSIVEKIIIPFLEKEGNFSNLKSEMQNASGKYNADYFRLLDKAEQAKIELSARTSTEIEIIMEDDNGDEIDEVLSITRSEFENLIKDFVDSTVEMIKKVITRNNLTPQDLQFILMVGGSTYIPYARQRVGELIGVTVKTDIDPTTAIVEGAAYYAGITAKNTASEEESLAKKNAATLQVKMSYPKTSQEKDEFFAARFKGNIEGLSYRIDREDGGFTTGLKPLKEKITEELPLIEKAYNFFKLTVYDKFNNVVSTDAELIGINAGGIGVSSITSPEDICLQIDDNNSIFGVTRTSLTLIVAKNTAIPTKQTITRTVNKTIVKGSDEKVTINILEGAKENLPEVNLSIGFLEITGKQLVRDLYKGSEVEITVNISESRDITATVYFRMIDQEFRIPFKREERTTTVEWLSSEVIELSNKLDSEIAEAEEVQDYETAAKLTKLKKATKDLGDETGKLSEDDVTDDRYKLENKKRNLAKELDEATKDKQLKKAKAQYSEAKESCLKLINESGNDYERKIVEDIVRQENQFLYSSSPRQIVEKSDELQAVYMQVLWRTPAFLVAIFKDLVTNHSLSMNNPEQVRSYVDAGKYAIESENWQRLGEVNQGLINLMPTPPPILGGVQTGVSTGLS
ncbi:MAG: Hsp70 family protein [Bacteroidota bacterium]